MENKFETKLSIEDKMLLIRDLSARLPYAVKVEHSSGFIGTLQNINTLHLYNGGDDIVDIDCDVDFFGDGDYFKIEHFRPYLFPLSSMTEKQKDEYQYIVNYISPDDTDNWQEGEFVYVGGQMRQLLYFYHINHLDYNNHIEKGLALDATNKNIY